MAIPRNSRRGRRAANKPAAGKTDDRKTASGATGELAPDGSNQDKALYLWCGYEALPAHRFPDDVTKAACEAITARAAYDTKGKTARGGDGKSMLDVRAMADGMRQLAICEGWQRMDTVDRALLDTLLETAQIYPRLRLVTIGAAGRDGVWRQPPPPVTDDDDIQSIWDITGPDVATPMVPGLIWPSCDTLVESGGKWGKTTLITQSVAAAMTGRECPIRDTLFNPPKSILIYSEMNPVRLREWISKFTGGERPAIRARRCAPLAQLAKDCKCHRPDAVIFDSFVDCFKRDRPGGNEWRAGDVRGWFTAMRTAVGETAGTLITNHVRKSDGQGRDSGDLHAAVDMILSLRDGNGKPGYEPPPHPERTLFYIGRWSEPTRRITYSGTHGYVPAKPTNTEQAADAEPFTDPVKRFIDAWLQAHPTDGWGRFRAAWKDTGLQCGAGKLSRLFNDRKEAVHGSPPIGFEQAEQADGNGDRQAVHQAVQPALYKAEQAEQPRPSTVVQQVVQPVQITIGEQGDLNRVREQPDQVVQPVQNAATVNRIGRVSDAAATVEKQAGPSPSSSSSFSGPSPPAASAGETRNEAAPVELAGPVEGSAPVVEPGGAVEDAPPPAAALPEIPGPSPPAASAPVESSGGPSEPPGGLPDRPGFRQHGEIDYRLRELMTSRDPETRIRGARRYALECFDGGALGRELSLPTKAELVKAPRCGSRVRRV